MRVFLIKPVDIGQDHQQISIDEMGNLSGQGIIIPEPNFFNRDGIILVDNWNNPKLKQCGECMSGIEKSATVCQVLMG